jgi:glycosyltransferase involved in cell wall biosynthesis
MFLAASRHIPGFSVLQIHHKEKQPRHLWSLEDTSSVDGLIHTVKSNADLHSYLQHCCPKMVIVAGYSTVKPLLVALWARIHRIPVILASDTWRNIQRRKWWLEGAKCFVLPLLFNGAWVPGEKGAEYMRSFGFAEHHIWRYMYVIDVAHFATKNNRWIPPEGFPEKFFLTVCRLSPEKNLTSLLQAYEYYCVQGGTWGLVIAGSGPQESILKASVDSSIAHRVYWNGWSQYHELPALYQAAGCFILSSIKEPWGQVVGEALAAGLPVLLSNRCGCLPEYCIEGMNGYSFEPIVPEMLTKRMLQVSFSSQQIREEMGTASKELVQRYTPETWARILIAMTRYFKQS